MKATLLPCVLAVAATAFLPSIAGAAPHAHLPARQHKPAAAKPARRPLPVRRFGPTGRAYILNTSRPGLILGDHMAIGKGMHPVPTAPAPKP